MLGREAPQHPQGGALRGFPGLMHVTGSLLLTSYAAGLV